MKKYQEFNSFIRKTFANLDDETLTVKLQNHSIRYFWLFFLIPFLYVVLLVVFVILFISDPVKLLVSLFVLSLISLIAFSLLKLYNYMREKQFAELFQKVPRITITTIEDAEKIVALLKTFPGFKLPIRNNQKLYYTNNRFYELIFGEGSTEWFQQPIEDFFVIQYIMNNREKINEKLPGKLYAFKLTRDEDFYDEEEKEQRFFRSFYHLFVTTYKSPTGDEVVAAPID